jgi:rRNA small subunit pseudouridine methyltransferase Nep1
MKGIKNEIKRGRPDLVHFSILEATTIPLYLQNKLNLFVHTIDDKVIHFGKNVHLPKSYHRFEGVIEKLYQEKKITVKNELLLEIKDQTFLELIDEINPLKIIGFSTEGQLSSYEKIAAQIPDNSCIVIGGFQKGHFSDSVQNKITDLFSIGNESFEGHVIVSRILYEYEKTIFM